MRLALVLGLLATLLCASAEAATVRHPRTRSHHLIVRPSQDVVPTGWYQFPGYKPIPPEENRNLDPSNRGSG
jgi:hypothetical protein